MTEVGAILVAGRAVPTARSLDALARQSPKLAPVVVVASTRCDARTAAWLGATVRTRGWTLIRTEAREPGAVLNAGLEHAEADWVLTLAAGDVPSPRVADEIAAAVAAAPDSAVLAGAVRTVALGVDETWQVGDINRPAALDPAHPGLRGLCWNRAAVRSLGGFDGQLPAAERYELWLRLLASGRRGVETGHVLVEVPVGERDALPAELDGDGHLAAVRLVHARFADLLRADAADIVEARARRVDRLGVRHHQLLVRRRDAGEAASRAVVPGPPVAPLPQRASPVSRDWGYERGGPIDRVWIERFLADHAADVKGVVLEVQEPDYTRRFGGDRVTRCDVVDLDEDNPRATVIADLRDAVTLASDAYDCVILTQTLHVVPQMHEVVAECHRILKPGGVLLATLPAVSRVCLEYGRDGDFWRVTPAGARHLVESVFGGKVEVTTFGNVLASSAFLYGLAPHEVPGAAFDVTDDYNPTLVGVRAVKRGATTHARRPERGSQGLVLLYHRVGGDAPDPHGLSVPADAFAAQVAWLATECAVLPVAALVEQAASGRLPPRAVGITFDDGYLDTLTTAAPCLASHALPATCFVATERLDGPHTFWWDALATHLLGPGPRPEELTVALPDRTWTFSMRTAGERLLAHGVVYHAVVSADTAARQAVLLDVGRWAGRACVAPDCRRMNGAEIRALRAAGVEIGAHTATHPNLTSLSPDAQVREMSESRAVLEGLSGTPVTSLAYPFGAFDDASVEAARQAGFAMAFTCESRAVGPADAPLRLPRLDVREQRLDRFTARVLHLLGEAR